MSKFNNYGRSINRSAISAITHRVDLYTNGSIDLPRLSQDLIATLNGTLNVPDDWRAAFMQEWAKIEEVNAVALDAGQTRPTNAVSEDVVAGALDGIQRLIEQAGETFG